MELLQDVKLEPPSAKVHSEILTEDAIRFVAGLQRKFSAQRESILKRREERQRVLDSGALPDFLEETRKIRESEWTISAEPQDLQDRRVEITGPAGDTKMVINAFNSGANAYMADFEDAQSPTWYNTIQGQVNLRDAIRRKISFASPEGKKYELNEKVATLIVRPRGWHLLEKHATVDGSPVSASLFDFGLFFFHNARELISRGTGPYFYLPKMESHVEARLWNDVFNYSEEALGIPRGKIKATVLIETILGGFEMDEILYELREHSSGLNCGRWDYIFSYIKKLRNRSEYVLPDRSVVTMDKAFLASYVDLNIKTCHRRNAHSIGGMSAYIPVKEESANRLAFDKVRQDKEREVRAGHDGTWVAHPGLVPVAKQVFDLHMKDPNQINSKRREDVAVSSTDLLRRHEGLITEQGLRTNISVGVQYIEAWLGGRGAVPLYNLMEDAATAEICRAQVWQWLSHGAVLSDGRKITKEMFLELLNQEMDKIRASIGDGRYASGHYEKAAKLFRDLSLSEEFAEFLTLSAYEILVQLEKESKIA